jgi:hypothetical protein
MLLKYLKIFIAPAFIISALLALGLSVGVLFKHNNTKTGILTIIVRNILIIISLGS